MTAMNIPSSLLKLLPGGIGDLLIRRPHLGRVDLAASEALFKSVKACNVSMRPQPGGRVCTLIDEILLLALWLSLGLVGGCGLASAEFGGEAGEFVHFFSDIEFGILEVLR
jgi:hypothetical protein